VIVPAVVFENRPEREEATARDTEVTVPVPDGFVHERVVPFDVSTWPLVPTVVRPGALATMISASVMKSRSD